MNTKTEITPEMVQRAYDAAPTSLLPRSTVEAMLETVEAMLEAAINPPLVPEVTVTDEMVKAGAAACEVALHNVDGTYREAACAIYRAMRKLEPKA